MIVKQVTITPAVQRWCCERHRESVERNRGWQQRQAAERKKARQGLAEITEEAKLFDPGPPRQPRRKPWEDAA